MLKTTKETVSTAAANQMNLGYDTTTTKPVIIDESGNIVVLGGFATKDYRLIRVTTISQGTTSYTPTTGTKAIYAEGWGAGGGSAGIAAATASQVAIGQSAGGGAYSASWLTAASISNFGNAWSCVVGLGGPGGALGANNGTAGTDTTLTDPGAVNRLTAKGGSASTSANTLASGTTAATSSTGAAGGTAASGTGDTKFSGGYGLIGFRASGTVGFSGAGGMCAAGGQGGQNNNDGSGTAGFFPGGGGGGAIDRSATAQPGGNGANGLLRIWEFA